MGDNKALPPLPLRRPGSGGGSLNFSRYQPVSFHNDHATGDSFSVIGQELFGAPDLPDILDLFNRGIPSRTTIADMIGSCRTTVQDIERLPAIHPSVMSSRGEQQTLYMSFVSSPPIEKRPPKGRPKFPRKLLGPEECYKCQLKTDHAKCEKHKYLRIGGGYRHSYAYIKQIMDAMAKDQISAVRVEIEKQEAIKREETRRLEKERNTVKRRVKVYLRTKSGNVITRYQFVAEDDYREMKNNKGAAKKLLGLDDDDSLEDFMASKQDYVMDKDGEMIKAKKKKRKKKDRHKYNGDDSVEEDDDEEENAADGGRHRKSKKDRHSKRHRKHKGRRRRDYGSDDESIAESGVGASLHGDDTGRRGLKTSRHRRDRNSDDDDDDDEKSDASDNGAHHRRRKKEKKEKKKKNKDRKRRDSDTDGRDRRHRRSRRDRDDDESEVGEESGMSEERSDGGQYDDDEHGGRRHRNGKGKRQGRRKGHRRKDDDDSGDSGSEGGGGKRRKGKNNRRRRKRRDSDDDDDDDEDDGAGRRGSVTRGGRRGRRKDESEDDDSGSDVGSDDDEDGGRRKHKSRRRRRKGRERDSDSDESTHRSGTRGRRRKNKHSDDDDDDDEDYYEPFRRHSKDRRSKKKSRRKKEKSRKSKSRRRDSAEDDSSTGSESDSSEDSSSDGSSASSRSRRKRDKKRGKRKRDKRSRKGKKGGKTDGKEGSQSGTTSSGSSSDSSYDSSYDSSRSSDSDNSPTESSSDPSETITSDSSSVSEVSDVSSVDSGELSDVGSELKGEARRKAIKKKKEERTEDKKAEKQLKKFTDRQKDRDKKREKKRKEREEKEEEKKEKRQAKKDKKAKKGRDVGGEDGRKEKKKGGKKKDRTESSESDSELESPEERGRSRKEDRKSRRQKKKDRPVSAVSTIGTVQSDEISLVDSALSDGERRRMKAKKKEKLKQKKTEEKMQEKVGERQKEQRKKKKEKEKKKLKKEIEREMDHMSSASDASSVNSSDLSLDDDNNSLDEGEMKRKIASKKKKLQKAKQKTKNMMKAVAKVMEKRILEGRDDPLSSDDGRSSRGVNMTDLAGSKGYKTMVDYTKGSKRGLTDKIEKSDSRGVEWMTEWKRLKEKQAKKEELKQQKAKEEADPLAKYRNIIKAEKDARQDTVSKLHLFIKRNLDILKNTVRVKADGTLAEDDDSDAETIEIDEQGNMISIPKALRYDDDGMREWMDDASLSRLSTPPAPTTSDDDLNEPVGVRRVLKQFRKNPQELGIHLKRILASAAELKPEDQKKPTLRKNSLRAVDERETTIDYMNHYRLVEKSKLDPMARSFVVEDTGRECVLTLQAMKDALNGVPSLNGLKTKHLEYVLKVLDLDDHCRITFKMFAVIGAICERMLAMDAIGQDLIDKSDLLDIQRKMDLYMSMFYCNTNTEHGDNFITLETLRIELKAGGLNRTQEEYIVMKMNANEYKEISFLDYMAYIPLFLSMHENIIDNPLDFAEKYNKPSVEIQRDMNPIGLPLKRSSHSLHQSMLTKGNLAAARRGTGRGRGTSTKLPNIITRISGLKILAKPPGSPPRSPTHTKPDDR